MKLFYKKQFNLKSYLASTKGSKIFALANEEGVDIFDMENKKQISSIVNFSYIKDIFFSNKEKYLIILNAENNLYCFDIENQIEISRLTNIESKFGNLLSLTTSLYDDELIILCRDKDKTSKTKLLTFSLPSLKLISIKETEYFSKLVRKSDIFNHYYLIGFDDTISYYDEDFSYLGNIKKSDDAFNIKRCVSITSPNRLIVQDFKKLYVYNSKYELVDEITLISENTLSKSIKQIEDDIDNSRKINFELFKNAKLVFSFGIYKNNYSLSIIDNLLTTDTSINLHNIDTSESLYCENILTDIKTILILNDSILISGLCGTYVFSDDEKNSDTDIITNQVSLNLLHKTNLISKTKN